MYRTFSGLVGAILLISASLPVGFSQTSTANLTGLISDPAGAAIPGVKINVAGAVRFGKTLGAGRPS